MCRLLLALALLSACSKDPAKTPEGAWYWACVDWYEQAMECDDCLTATRDEGCDQPGFLDRARGWCDDSFNLIYCDTTEAVFDLETCDEIRDEIRRIEEAAEDGVGNTPFEFQGCSG